MNDNKLNDIETNKNEMMQKVSKEKQKINTISLFILIIGIIFIIIGIVLTITSTNNDNNTSNDLDNIVNDNDNNSSFEDIDEEEDNKLKEIEISDKELKALETLPIIELNANNMPLYNVYQSKKINVQDVDIKVMLGNVVKKIDNTMSGTCTSADWKANSGLCTHTYSTEIIKDKLKEIYGDFNYDFPAYFGGSGFFKCTLVEDHYACSHGGGDFLYTPYSSYFGWNFQTEMGELLIKNVKCETDGTYIYIYQDFARLKLYLKNNDENDLSNYEFRVYKYSDKDELLVDKIFIGKDYYEEGDNVTPFLTKIANELEGKLTTFKHTFKIDENGNYIWISTEEAN